ncbi:MAG TPA: gas vesicle protein GvpO [Micromonosporaceae bacterium]|nr:gas vesicle protein GvpO [Micromonosporaceae bacterium]
MAGEDGTRRTRDRHGTDVDAPAETRYDDEEYEDTNHGTRDYDDDYDDGERARAPAKQKRRPPPTSELSAAEAAAAASRHVAELTGKPTQGVTALKPSEDGWTVGVEVLEDSRIPSSADVLAMYEADVDLDGALLSYHRVNTYPRGRGDRGGGS